ncbi:gamma carbonic anhydrase family protein [Corynebacterium sp. HMSC05D03]|uniref:gamma carbonic anhydrase family protein n=1 Tax=Corynebacterium sp. HMSC05D03 TaxID=1581115 RepID=UPI0008A61C5E|nr:gamma carbonic anhydrase family protein [Corynebacterium sp. HMSC05D03]OFT64709.1 gamma carbonic anhydrase family protein [Corynebacterium sp. HMSC05D03]
MLILPFQGKTPRIHRSAWIAPTATIIGDVTIGPDSSVFYGSVLRGDVGTIHLGARVNIQDNCVIHVESTNPCILEDDVTVGHMAMLHGTQVGAGTLVGMKASLLSGCKVGTGSLIAAGAVVLEGQEIPAGCLAAGVPAKVRRELSEEESAAFIPHAAGYVELSHSQAQMGSELSLESVLYD